MLCYIVMGAVIDCCDQSSCVPHGGGSCHPIYGQHEGELVAKHISERSLALLSPSSVQVRFQQTIFVSREPTTPQYLQGQKSSVYSPL